MADLTATKLTVIQAIKIEIRPANTKIHQETGALKAKWVNQLEIHQYDNGAAMQ